MNQPVQNFELKAGDRISSVTGERKGVVLDLLGSGGQGAVYKTDFGDRTFALKWYHQHYLNADRTLESRLRRVISRGAPDRRFLWPLELVHADGRDGFGYIMALRPAEYYCIREILAPPPRRIDLSLEKRFKICWQIADSFLHLHANGFCYQDINLGNIFIHPSTADVMICDNDNVNVDGAEASIYGARKFMAPEIVRRECLPNTRTDLFSMSVMFFYTLLNWHPLDGRREAEARILSPKVEEELYGTKPLFIFDPDDDANGPLSTMHDPIVWRWRSLPQKVQTLFRRAFGRGLAEPNARVVEKEWMKALEQVCSAAFLCENCRHEHVWTIDNIDQESAPCARCGMALRMPPALKIGEKIISLVPERAVSQHDIGNATAATWESAGIVVEHPERKGVFGLKNTMDSRWVVRTPDNKASSVSPGKTILLSDRLEVDFGSHKGVIRNPMHGEISDSPERPDTMERSISE